MLHHLAQPLRDRVEVAPGQTAVGREALGQDQQVAARRRQVVVAHRQPAADVRETVEEQRDLVPIADCVHAAQVLELFVIVTNTTGTSAAAMIVRNAIAKYRSVA